MSSVKFNTSPLKRGQRSQKESHFKTIDCQGLWSEFLLAAFLAKVYRHPGDSSRDLLIDPLSAVHR